MKVPGTCASSSFLLIGALCLAPAAFAGQSHQDLHAALESWRARHGGGWEIVRDEGTGFARFLYGGAVAPAFAPRDEADLFALARVALDDASPLFGIDGATLVEDEASFLPLGNAGSSDKESVRFRQLLDGVPVEHGFVNVLFDSSGDLLSIDATALPALASVSVEPQVAAFDAARTAERFFLEDTGVRADGAGEPVLAIEQIVRGGARVPVLVWRVRVERRIPWDEPLAFTYSVDALDLSRVAARNEIHRDVSGNVKSLLSPGLYPDEASNPEALEPMAHIDVTSSQGNATTDSNGDFTIVGATEPVDVTVMYSGPFCQVINAAGGNHATTALLTQPSGNQVSMNPLADQLTTAQANAFKWVNALRDHVRAINPSDAHADFQVLANVNLPATCNALYDGFSVNFFIEAGGCVNTAYSTVVAHETGHWMNDQYGSGNGSDGFGEGNADVWAIYLADDPYNGRDWSGPGTYVRTGNNLRQFCGDCCGGCYGEVHDDGEVLMGALWKVRANLKSSLGAAAGGLAADLLFNGWMNAYDDSEIKTIVRTHWLVLDDDDASLANGTPHFAAIDGGFQTQGFPPFAPPCPSPVVYCTAKTTSLGSLPSIGWSGSPTVTANDFVVQLTNAVPDRPGIVFYGSQSNAVPFYNGTLCAKQPVKRSPLMMINSFGALSVPVPVASSMIGVTRYYQFWFRDGQQTDGTGVGLSDALQVRFCLD